MNIVMVNVVSDGNPKTIKKHPMNAPFLFSRASVKSGIGNYLVYRIGC